MGGDKESLRSIAPLMNGLNKIHFEKKVQILDENYLEEKKKI